MRQAQVEIGDNDARPFAHDVGERRVDDVGVADKVGDKEVGRLLVEFARAALLGDLRLGHDNDPVGDRHRLLLVVRHIDDGQREAQLQRADVVAHLAAQFGVEVGERLVEEQHQRLEHQRARDRDALLLAARQFRRIAPIKAAQPDKRQLLGGELGGAALCDAADGGAVGDVLQHCHMREEGVGLKHHADVAPARRQLRHIAAADQDAALGGALKPGDEAQRRRLATARGAEQRRQRAGFDGERDIVDRERRAVALADRLELDCGCRHRAQPMPWTATGARAARRPRRRSPTTRRISSTTASMIAISAEEYAIASPNSPASTRPTM